MVQIWGKGKGDEEGSDADRQRIPERRKEKERQKKKKKKRTRRKKEIYQQNATFKAKSNTSKFKIYRALRPKPKYLSEPDLVLRKTTYTVRSYLSPL